MISRRVTAGFVCLSCRLALAGSRRSRLPSLVYSTAPRRTYTEAATPTNDQEQQQQQQQEEEKASFRRVHIKDKHDKLRHRSTRRPSQPPPEVYRSKAGQVLPKEEALSIDILGKPAHAIVMKPFGSAHKKRGIRNAEAESDPGHVNLSDILDKQIGIPTADEVLQNIHELRPPHSRSIPQKDFDSLRDVLVKGFTKAQLVSYMAHYRPETEPTTTTTPESNPPWVLEQWPWLPEAAPASNTADPALDGYLHTTMSPKEQLAVRLIRECWRVATHEVENSQGYLDVKLRDLEFALLLVENGRRLEGISRSLLAPGKQIELIRPDQVVRIVASKTTAEVILREIHSLLAKLETRAIDAKLLAAECLSPTSLEEVSRITNTVVQLDVDSQEIRAYWITDTRVSDTLENSGDIVFRLLLSASGAKAPSHGKVSVLPESDAKGGRFVIESYNKEKWSWKDRTRQWARWVTPTAATAGEQATNQLVVAIPTVFGSGIELGSTAVPSDEPSVSPAGWPTALQRSTSAIFGHILHQYPPQNSSQGVDLTQPSIISPVIPPLSALALPQAAKPPTPSSSTILMRFLPDPSQDPSVVSAAPPLELRLEASDTEISSISSLRAIVTAPATAATHDILLPSSTVDVRLRQAVFHELAGDALSSDPLHADHPILAFLDASDLRPAAGRLVTPARLPGVAVPLVSSPHDAASTTTTDGVVDYLFAGLEMRRAVATNYEGWSLMYTDVEAGQGGGRRAELSLEAVPSPSTEEAEARSDDHGAEERVEKVLDAASYLEVVARIAAGREFKWYGEES